MSDTGGSERDDGAGTGHLPGFEGVVGRTFAGSQGGGPSGRAAADAPNIIVMLVDDPAGADLGCYGSEIETPNLDRLAPPACATRISTSPPCAQRHPAAPFHRPGSPLGVGSVAHSDAGFPYMPWSFGTNGDPRGPPTTATMRQVAPG